MNNNLPMVKNKESIFAKIKCFIKKIFNIGEDIENNYSIKEDKAMVNNNFKDNIKIQEDKELKELIKLQEQFEKGTIREEDLSEEQIISLEKLYNSQIKELNEKFENCKKRILHIKKQISTNC